MFKVDVRKLNVGGNLDSCCCKFLLLRPLRQRMIDLYDMQPARPRWLSVRKRIVARAEQNVLADTVIGLFRDQNLRADSSVEKLAKLQPAFGKAFGDQATMTAANSTPLTDGASAVLLASDEWAVEHNLPVLAHLVDGETAAVDYVHGNRKDDGLLMAPVYALPRLLARQHLVHELRDPFHHVVTPQNLAPAPHVANSHGRCAQHPRQPPPDTDGVRNTPGSRHRRTARELTATHPQPLAR